MRENVRLIVTLLMLVLFGLTFYLVSTPEGRRRTWLRLKVEQLAIELRRPFEGIKRYEGHKIGFM